MGAVHIGIGHDDDLVIAELIGVELVPDPGPQSRDDRLELVVAVHLVGAGFLHIEHLAPQGRMAWKRESRPWVAEPPAESPSTI